MKETNAIHRSQSFLLQAQMLQQIDTGLVSSSVIHREYFLLHQIL